MDIKNIVEIKENIVKEALEYRYENDIDTFEIENLKSKIEVLSKLFDTKVAKYNNLIAQESHLMDDIDNSAVFSFEMDDPSDPYNDKAQLVDRKYDNEQDIRNTLLEIEKYYKQIINPYFGSLNTSSARRYIGRYSVVDDKFNVLISDWRSPIGQLYYQFTKPDEEILDKRMYKIGNGILDEYVTVDENSTHSDAILLSELKSKKGGKLVDIVNTIQKHQDTIIRFDDSGPMILQGVAGSGKTTVLFHRIAYLQFKDPAYYQPNKVLLIVPSKMFRKYTEEIKISLGLGDTAIQTYFEFISSYLKLDFPWVIKESKDGNSANLDLISKKFAQRELELFKYAVISHKSAEDMINLFKQLSTKDTLLFMEKVTDVLDTYEVDDKDREEILNTLSLDFIYSYIFNDSEILNQVNKYKEYKSSIKVKDEQSYIERQFKNTPIVKLDLSQLNSLTWLKILTTGVGGYKQNLIAVDEAQNIDKSMLKILLTFANKENLILAGDMAQKVDNDNITSWDDFRTQYENAPIYFEMDTTYRISKEVIEYINSLGLSSRYIPKAVVSKPDSLKVIEELKIDDLVKTIEQIDTGSDVIAVITNGNALKESITEYIKETTLGLKLNTSLFIIDINQSKGLEFDKVIAIGFEDYDNKKYLSLTRSLDIVIDVAHILFN